jgi:hypothetical protein
MPQVGFEPMIPVSELEKTGYVLDLVSIVIGFKYNFNYTMKGVGRFRACSTNGERRNVRTQFLWDH